MRCRATNACNKTSTLQPVLFKKSLQRADKERLLLSSLCWLLVVFVGPNWPVRTPHAVSCSLPIPQRTCILSSIDSYQNRLSSVQRRPPMEGGVQRFPVVDNSNCS